MMALNADWPGGYGATVLFLFRDRGADTEGFGPDSAGYDAKTCSHANEAACDFGPSLYCGVAYNDRTRAAMHATLTESYPVEEELES